MNVPARMNSTTPPNGPLFAASRKQEPDSPANTTLSSEIWFGLIPTFISHWAIADAHRVWRTLVGRRIIFPLPVPMIKPQTVGLSVNHCCGYGSLSFPSRRLEFQVIRTRRLDRGRRKMFGVSKAHSADMPFPATSQRRMLRFRENDTSLIGLRVKYKRRRGSLSLLSHRLPRGVAVLDSTHPQIGFPNIYPGYLQGKRRLFQSPSLARQGMEETGADPTTPPLSP